jgi:hypothetical protein
MAGLANGICFALAKPDVRHALRLEGGAMVITSGNLLQLRDCGTVATLVPFAVAAATASGADPTQPLDHADDQPFVHVV